MLYIDFKQNGKITKNFLVGKVDNNQEKVLNENFFKVNHNGAEILRSYVVR